MRSSSSGRPVRSTSSSSADPSPRCRNRAPNTRTDASRVRKRTRVRRHRARDPADDRRHRSRLGRDRGATICTTPSGSGDRCGHGDLDRRRMDRCAFARRADRRTKLGTQAADQRVAASLTSALPPGREELDEKRSALVRPDAAGPRHPVVQHRPVEQIEAATRRTCLGIGGPIDEVSETGVDHRTRAHRARLERDDEGAVLEPPVADLLGRVAQRQYLGVRCGSPVSSRSLWRAASTSPSRTTTAPTGTSPCSSAARASSSATCIHAACSVGGVDAVGRLVGVRHGGGSGIRTHGEFPHTRFPSVPIRPLSHPSTR